MGVADANVALQTSPETKLGFCGVWFMYPHLKDSDIAKGCLVCRGNCNCKACLRSNELIKKMKKETETKEDEKVELSIYFLQVLLPYLRLLEEEQMIENEKEAKIQGES
ncbi:hypothetical protein Fmac_017241 [Flemingia macrophylla]|uniref:Zinc-finger domain-containing protein n=1 Tax=Flemingia macrophylla TaxID=520843 RepID=A0ABD1M3F7_9FABA